MSGGSFEYLYTKAPEDLMDKANWIDEMAKILIKQNYLDVAQDMERLAEYIRSAYIRIDVLSKQLRPVMKAVEYYEDGDIGDEKLKKIIEEYRTEESDGRVNTDN